jgi:hypothetical protein
VQEPSPASAEVCCVEGGEILPHGFRHSFPCAGQDAPDLYAGSR